MNHQEARALALESFKQNFPLLDDETAEKVMDAFITAKVYEQAKRN